MVIHSFDNLVLFLQRLLVMLIAIDKVAYSSVCNRLLDGVCFRVLMTGYDCTEESFFANGASWFRITWREPRCFWSVNF